MATDFIMPRFPDQHAYTQAIYNQSTAHPPSSQFPPQNYPQISPLSTSNPSNTSGPQSPKSHYGRQVRPLYMPAVLRPNEHPSKPRCDSRSDSTFELVDTAGTSPVRPNSSYLGLAGLNALNRLRRRSTDEKKKQPKDDLQGWNLDVFPAVTDMPTRRHWKPDAESTICDEPTCKRYFSYFTRRHHCRRCGNIFCDLHSSHEIPLDQNAEYNPRAPTLSRACNHCFSEFSVWRSRTNSQVSSTASSEANLHMLAHGHQRSYSHQVTGGSSTPIVASPAAINTPNPLNNLQTPDAAASVPRDWNWSTF